MLILPGLAFVACGKKQNFPAPNKSVFDSAPAELKDMWGQALEADRTNDYYKAEVLLYEIIRQNPAPEQTDEARKELVIVHHRMQDAVEKGDPEAKAAFQKFRENPPNRPMNVGSQQQ